MRNVFVWLHIEPEHGKVCYISHRLIYGVGSFCSLAVLSLLSNWLDVNHEWLHEDVGIANLKMALCCTILPLVRWLSSEFGRFGDRPDKSTKLLVWTSWVSNIITYSFSVSIAEPPQISSSRYYSTELGIANWGCSHSVTNSWQIFPPQKLCPCRFLCNAPQFKTSAPH